MKRFIQIGVATLLISWSCIAPLHAEEIMPAVIPDEGLEDYIINEEPVYETNAENVAYPDISDGNAAEIPKDPAPENVESDDEIIIEDYEILSDVSLETEDALSDGEETALTEPDFNVNQDEERTDNFEVSESAYLANTSVESATSINVNSTYADSCIDNKDTNFYKFNLPNSGYISITFGKEYDKNSSKRWYVELYNSSQVKLISRTFYAGNTLTDTTNEIGLPAGIYYIKIWPGQYDWSSVTYSLAVNYTADNLWEHEFNDNVSTADNILTNQMYYGSSMENQDPDFYTFSIDAPGHISISFGKEYDKNSSKRWYVELYNSSQTKLISRTFYAGNTLTDTTNEIGLPAGNYYIKIWPGQYDWSSATYNLTVNYAVDSMWECEFNDGVSSANAIQTGQVYYGSSMSSKDVDYYKFTLDNPGYINILFGKEYDKDSSNNWKMELYNSSQVFLASRTYYTGNTERWATYEIGLPAGTYYVKISPDAYDWSSVTYNIEIKFTADNMWEKELNDTVAQANAITAGQTYCGSLMEPKELDYYKVQLESDCYMRLTFNHGFVDSTNKYWYVRLYNDSFKKIKEYGYVGNKIENTEDWMLLDAGTYYIEVTSDYDWSSLAYSMLINITVNQCEIVGHSYGDWQTVTAATVWAEGTKQRVCSVCGNTETAEISRLTPTIKLSAKSITLKTKQSTTKVKVGSLAAGDYVKSWATSDPRIVRVSDKGKITAQTKAGKATITVTLASGKKAKITVKVQKNTVKASKITGVSKSLSLKRGKTKTLRPKISPVTCTEKIKYRSSNKKVAAVSSKGKITAKKKGTAVITVSCGKKSVKVKVTVR